MANFSGTARSSYFEVKDRAAFEAWALSRSLVVLEGEGKHEGLVGIAPNEQLLDDGCWPTSDAEGNDIDVGAQLQAHLKPEWAAVLVQVGSEKQRYVGGWVAVVTQDGVVDRYLHELIAQSATATGLRYTLPSY